jgi:hypothetical protein
MITTLLLSITALFLIGTGMLVRSLSTSVEGYQDAFGFHQGKQPLNRVRAERSRSAGTEKVRRSPRRRAHKARQLEFAS